MDILVDHIDTFVYTLTVSQKEMEYLIEAVTVQAIKDGSDEGSAMLSSLKDATGF